MGRQKREMAKRIGIELFLILAIGLVLGLFGPFGSYAMPVAERIISWMMFAVLGYIIFRPMVILGSWMSEALRVSPIIGVGLALAIAAVPMTLLIETLFAGFDPGAALRSRELGQRYFQVWLIGFLIYGLMHLLFARQRPAREPEPPLRVALSAAAITEPLSLSPAPAGVSRVLSDRLRRGFGPVLAINSEDHYVRVFGTAHEALVLLRMRDAIAELSLVEGLQVHRSWWVAREGLASVRRDGRSVTLVLSNGREVPVAREKLAMLRRAGWLQS
jgi:LytTr DNA-binding domain